MANSPPIPSPNTLFSKGLLDFIEDTFIDPYRDAYAWISGFDTIEEARWRYVVVTFQRSTPAGTVEDLAQVGFNILNTTAGLVDNTWDDGDFTTVNSALGSFLNQWASLSSSTHQTREIRYYIRGFNPDVPLGQPVTTLDPATGKPYRRFINTGTVERVYSTVKVGASTQLAVPYQVAMSMTFRTAQRKHWGRVYLPGVIAGATSSFGRFTNPALSIMADSGAELADALNDAEFLLVVPTTQVGGKFHFALQTVTEVIVDDIPDVIRRRRPKQAAVHQVGVPT